MSKRIFIYIGPHRSGSNFLNNHVLPHIPGVFTAYTRDPDIHYVLMNAMDGHPMFTDYAAIRAELNARLDRIEEDVVLLGSEEFFGDYGRYNGDGRFLSPPFYDHSFKMELLARVFDQPRVLLTIRRQDKWIESAYMHHIHNYHTIHFEDFIDPPRGSQGWNYSKAYRYRSAKPSCDYRMLDWSVYLENLIRLFGRNNVLVIPNEMMAEDLHVALKRLYAFMGVAGFYPEDLEPTNRSLSKAALTWALVLNRFVRIGRNPCGIIPETPFINYILAKRRANDTRLWWFLNGISRRIRLYWFLSEVVSRINYRRPDPLSAEKRKEILDYFRQSNKKYAEMIGVDLGKYGYY